MPGSHIQLGGFLTINSMMQDVVSKMTTAGFELVFPSNIAALNVSEGNYDVDILGKAKPATRKRWCAILRPTVDVNPNEDQPWMIKFEWDITTTSDGILDVIVGTPSQFNLTTGAHTFYTAKYMSNQKREIVLGDSTKVDKAYDYKEVLGIVGTAFRSNDALITNPDFIVKGSKSAIADITTGAASGSLAAYPMGDTDLVINYKTFSSTLLNSLQGILPSQVSSNYASLLGAAGLTTSALSVYKTEFDITSSARYEANTHVKYNDNFYRVKSTISKISDLSIDTSLADINDLVDNGTPATTVANKRFWIEGKIYKKEGLIAKKIANYPGNHGDNYSGTKNVWFKLGNQFILTAATASGAVYNASIPTDTVITTENSATYKVSQFIDITSDILYTSTNIADLYDLQYVSDLPLVAPFTTPNELLDLRQATAELYNLIPVSEPNKTYIYDAVQDRLYSINSLVDTIGSAAAANTNFPTTSFPYEFVWGAYNLSYVGKYTDYLAASTLSKSYYDTFESEDVDGYDTRLSDGDISFPAIRRNKNKTSKMFFNREHISSGELPTYPIGYTLVTTSRGIVFAVHEETSDEVGNRNSWIVVQRPVDHVSGAVYTTGKAPVHCMYSIMSRLPNKPWIQEDLYRGTIDYGYSIRKTATGTGIELFKSNNYTVYIPAPDSVHIRRFIVRESDITAPYPTHSYVKNAFGVNMDYALGGFPFGVPADQHTPDYNAVINAKQQVAISEGNKYVITFPNGFNTARYAYTHEMDMLAYTSADVISAGTEIDITAYGETRTYIALHSNGPNNTGMRVLVLKQGGGIA